MITPEVLISIRQKRIKKAAGKNGGGQFAMLAKNYADRFTVLHMKSLIHLMLCDLKPKALTARSGANRGSFVVVFLIHHGVSGQKCSEGL